MYNITIPAALIFSIVLIVIFYKIVKILFNTKEHCNEEFIKYTNEEAHIWRNLYFRLERDFEEYREQHRKYRLQPKPLTRKRFRDNKK